MIFLTIDGLQRGVIIPIPNATDNCNDFKLHLTCNGMKLERYDNSTSTSRVNQTSCTFNVTTRIMGHLEAQVCLGGNQTCSTLYNFTGECAYRL